MPASPSPAQSARSIDPHAVHFLHIGKTGGSAISRMLKNAVSPACQTHRHSIKLRDLPRGARYFFSIRQPVSRFYSGFYSRKRQGKPLFSFPWSPDEALAFRTFEHANDLAEALFDPAPIGLQAVQAILSIQHTAQKQVSWFEAHGQIFDIHPPVWIVRQENFAGDLARLRERVQLELSAEPGTEPVHANDYSGLPPLTDKAKANLERWYSDDIAFYTLCEQWLAANS